MPKLRDNLIILAFLALLVAAAFVGQTVKNAAEASASAVGEELAAYSFGEPSGGDNADAVLSSGGTSSDGVFVPIIMYHSICGGEKTAGKYVLLPSELESDLKWLRDNGYETVLVSDLVDYVSGGSLPEKPVMLTFDDGYYNNLVYAYPLLEKYDMRAVISVVGAYTDRYASAHDRTLYYSCLSYEDVKLLALSGRFEIGNHSDDMHRQSARRGAMRMSGESAELYRERLRADMDALQSKLYNNSGVCPAVYTYPYGQISPESEQVVRDAGFAASLTCYEKPNYITRDPECLYLLNRWNRPSGESTPGFMRRAGLN